MLAMDAHSIAIWSCGINVPPLSISILIFVPYSAQPNHAPFTVLHMCWLYT